MAVKQNYDFLRIVSFVETLMNSERYIVVLDLFGDQESVNMRRWCRKINYSSFTLKEYPSISQPLSVIFLSYFTVCSPFPLSFRVQSFHWSKIESIKLWAMDCRKICFKVNSFEVIVLLILFWPKTVNLFAPEKKYDIHTAHRRLFHLHPTHPPPQGFSIPGGLWWPHSPEEFPEYCKEGVLTTHRNSKWFLKVNSITKVQ